MAQSAEVKTGAGVKQQEEEQEPEYEVDSQVTLAMGTKSPAHVVMTALDTASPQARATWLY